MKIIKKGKILPIECELCGTIFKHNFKEIKATSFNKNYVDCPMCGRLAHVKYGKERAMKFRVIDNETGKEADVNEIANNEEWADSLCYCDIEGFALLENGSLVLLDECGNYEYCPSDRFAVVFEKEQTMNKEKQIDEKQIEEMAKVINEMDERNAHYYDKHMQECEAFADADNITQALYNAGYRKQEEGEWVYHECVSSYDGAKSGYSCSRCHSFVDEDVFDTDEFHKSFCGNCGAKMKGKRYG